MQQLDLGLMLGDIRAQVRHTRETVDTLARGQAYTHGEIHTLKARQVGVMDRLHLLEQARRTEAAPAPSAKSGGSIATLAKWAGAGLAVAAGAAANLKPETIADVLRAMLAAKGAG